MSSASTPAPSQAASEPNAPRRKGLGALRRADFDPVACGIFGHVTYLPDEPQLAERLQIQTPVGEAVRCLRCGTYVPGPPRATGPADSAPLVRRGRALQDAFILRLLSLQRLGHFVFFTVLALAVWRFRGSQGNLAASFYSYLPLFEPLAQRLGIDLGTSKLVLEMERILAAQPRTLTLITLALVAYALLELAEAVGLWLMRRWGEYVAAVGTSVLVPYEIYELVHSPTVFKALALLINLAAVAYLVLTKRLFGLRGGKAAYEKERHADSLLEIEKASVAEERSPRRHHRLRRAERT